MTVITLASLAGAPGVSTAALALGTHWPRDVFVVEADTNSVTSSMAGYFRSNLRPDTAGLDKVAMAFSSGVLEARDFLDPSTGLSIAVHDLPPVPDMPIPALPVGHRMWVLPGFHRMNIVRGVDGLWPRLSRLLRHLSEAGVDVIVDTGRLGLDDGRLSLLDGSDKVIILGATTMVDLNRLYRRVEEPDLGDRLDGAGRIERYRLLLTQSRYESIPAEEFAKHLMPVVAELPFDPEGAAVFSLGRPDARPQRNAYRNAIRRLANSLGVQTSSDFDRKVG
ncbi:hypothetical protein [Leifsonia shinshuensis]